MLILSTYLLLILFEAMNRKRLIGDGRVVIGEEGVDRRQKEWVGDGRGG